MKKNYLFTLFLMLTTQLFWAQITVVGTANFTSCAGTASPDQIFAVSDNQAGGDVIVTAPEGFELKTTSGNYGSSVVISTNGSSQIPITQIYIRLKSDATGTLTDNVSFSGSSRTTINLPVTGTVIALQAPPTIATSGLTTFCEGSSVTLAATPNSSTLTTTFAGGNGQRGNMFEIIATKAVTITKFDAHPQSNTTIAIYYRPGTFVGFEGSTIGWTLVGSAAVVANPFGSATPVPLDVNVSIPAGEKYSFYITSTNSGTLNYTNGTGVGNVYASDSNISILEGIGIDYPFGEKYTPRIANINVHYAAASYSSYIWSNNQTTNSITVSSSGNYTVKGLKDGCTSASSSPTTITVNALAITPTITTSGNATFCQGGSVTLTSTTSASPLSTYTWSKDGTLYMANSKTITVSESGLYTVTVNNGVCNSLPSTVRKVTVNPLPEKPTITTSGPTGLCTGGSVTLTSSSATGNLWSTGANTQSITVSTAGTYSVTATSLGCTSISSEESAPGITVTVATPPARPTITTSRSTTICAGGTVTLTSSVANCKWSTGATTPSITVTNAGSYTVKANNEGCLSSSSLGKTVVVNALLTTPTISVIGSTNLNPGGSVTLTSSSATVNRWSTGATTRSIKVTTAGIYTVMVPGTCSSAWSTGVTVTSGSSQPTRFAETTQKEATSKIAIYPNPSKGVFNVDSDTDGDFYIANQLGQVVKEFKVIKNSANAINVENLSDGLYFVKNLNQNKSNKLIIKK